MIGGALIAALLVLTAGCNSPHEPVTADAQYVDAYIRPQPGDWCGAAHYQGFAECWGGIASTRLYLYLMLSQNARCNKDLQKSQVTCTAGCAIDGLLAPDPPNELEPFGSRADVMCSETPEATLGQPCTKTGDKPCLPTRAQIAEDGSVAGQTYLACDDATLTCVPAAAPTFAGFLHPCDSDVVAAFAQPGINGKIRTSWVDVWSSMCLLAWDDAANRMTSGKTRVCVGDWQCPAGSLCDDKVTDLEYDAPQRAVCKPGPRSVLTPAMLSP